MDEKRLSVKELYDALLGNERSKASKVKSHSDIKRVKGIRIPIEDLSLFYQGSRGGIRQYGYDFDKIIAEYSNLELSKSQFQLCRDIFSSIKNWSL